MMPDSTTTIRFGTRGSDLALWQTKYVMSLLHAASPAVQVDYEIISTKGDQVLDTPLPLLGGKGLFTAELEAGLHSGRIDGAVHSLKDLPTEQPEGLAIGAITVRAIVNDALISRHGYTLRSLPAGARIGTSSYRRASQLLYRRPDLQMIDIRGNVGTRISKAMDENGPYDAILLACAGLHRLGQTEVISETIDIEDLLPAPGQAAIAVQTRDEDSTRATLAPVHHQETAFCVTAERAFLAGLGGGCSVPVAAYATWQDGELSLHGRVNSRDGREQIDVRIQTSVSVIEDAQAAGAKLADEARSQGAQGILEQPA